MPWLTCTTSGIATANHLMMEEIAAREGVQMPHMPCRSPDEAALAVVPGEVMSIADAAAWAPLVDGGRRGPICARTAE